MANPLRPTRRSSLSDRLTATAGTMFDASCNQNLAYEAEVVDLNEDGQPEMLTKVYGTCEGGGARVNVNMNLLMKGSDGRWHLQFGFSGIPQVPETGHLGLPATENGGPGFCSPVWRWGRAGLCAPQGMSALMPLSHSRAITARDVRRRGDRVPVWVKSDCRRIAFVRRGHHNMRHVRCH